MFIIASVIAIVSYGVVLSIYLLYVTLILRNHKTREYIRLIDQVIAKPLAYEDLPDVTAIIPVYNEEAVVSKKLHNLSELDYPIERIEVLLVDDCSIDRTREIAENVIRELGLNGKIIRNSRRMGTNASYNNGVPKASNALILRTDADVMIKADALRKAVQIISNFENVGGVAGIMAPMMDTTTMATKLEKSYRNLFDQMSIAESALHSTFPGGGGFTLVKRSAFSPISVEQGSTDGNISISIIKKGFRHIYVPETFFLEPISRRLSEQVRQKARRASRLIQSTVINKDVLFNKKYQEFGTTIFPLRFAMFTICPLLMLTGIISTFYLLFSYSLVLLGLLAAATCLLLLAGTKTKLGLLNSVTSVLIQQFYLLLGLFLMGKRMSTWKSVERTVSISLKPDSFMG